MAKTTEKKKLGKEKYSGGTTKSLLKVLLA